LTLKQEYRQYIDSNFQGFEIRKPLFYNWDKGLRFDLQVGKVNSDEYFINVQNRANELFESVFNNNDRIFIVLNEYKWRRKKIRDKNYVYNQIENLHRDRISYRKINNLYIPGDKFDNWNQAIIKTKVGEVNYMNIIAAIGNIDFPQREPRLDKAGFLSNKEIYFINIEKPLIFNMYDDRGLDIITSDIKYIEPIYNRYNDWILDYDRELIDKQMKK
jgi:hypothetical protein